jgi:hypothetical protein
MYIYVETTQTRSSEQKRLAHLSTVLQLTGDTAFQMHDSVVQFNNHHFSSMNMMVTHMYVSKQA